MTNRGHPLASHQCDKLHRFCVSAELHQAEPEPESYTAWIVEQEKRGAFCFNFVKLHFGFKHFVRNFGGLGMLWQLHSCLLFKVSRSQVICSCSMSMCT